MMMTEQIYVKNNEEMALIFNRMIPKKSVHYWHVANTNPENGILAL